MDYSGCDFWLTKLNQFTQPGDDVQVRVRKAEMVKAFIISGEYKQRTARESRPARGATL